MTTCTVYVVAVDGKHAEVGIVNQTVTVHAYERWARDELDKMRASGEAHGHEVFSVEMTLAGKAVLR